MNDPREPSRIGSAPAALFLGTLCLATFLLGMGLALPAAAEESSDWPDPRRERMERALQEWAAERAAAEEEALVATGMVALRHGVVSLVADLARVVVRLEVHNPTSSRVEWTRAFAMDPLAEAVGAVLLREGQEPVAARTLATPDARRIYDQTRTPPTPRTPPSRRSDDPLRVERPSRDRIEVTVWPVGPGETVHVALEFVSPLRGRGQERTYVEVLGRDLGAGTRETTAQRPERPVAATTPGPAVMSGMGGTVRANWLVRPGDLVLASASADVRAAGAAGDTLRFVASGPVLDHPRITFRPPAREATGEEENEARTAEVLAVPGGSWGALTAIWRFDPAAFLEAQGLTPRRGMVLRLVRRHASTSRIAPWTFSALDEPLPVAARLLPGSATVRYAVEVEAAGGELLGTYEVERPVRRLGAPAPRGEARATSGTVTGWHRASLVGRVLAWAGDDPRRSEAAIAYAVDVGVLVPGTAALAVPRDEQRLLPRASRSQYLRDGVPLGAQAREADLTAPPAAAVAR